MKKSDLKTGMQVTTRTGDKYIVFLDAESITNSGDMLINRDKESSWNRLRDYNEDLTSNCFPETDIVKVEKLYHPYSFIRPYEDRMSQVLWEREEYLSWDELELGKRYIVKKEPQPSCCKYIHIVINNSKRMAISINDARYYILDDPQYKFLPY